MHLPIEDIKFLTVMNVLYLEAIYHNVGIFMYCKVASTASFRNLEPEKCTDWHWVPWTVFIELTPHFIPFKYFWEQGYKSLDKIKQQVQN